MRSKHNSIDESKGESLPVFIVNKQYFIYFSFTYVSYC